MKILFIAPRLPLPADTGGKIRTFNLIKQAAKKYKTDLVCFSFEEDDNEHAKGLKALGVRVTLVPVREPGLLRTVFSVLFDAAPCTITKYRSKAMRETVIRLARENDYDLIHADHVHMSQYSECCNGYPCVVDEHNVEYKLLERCARVEKSFIRRAVFDSQARKMKRFEAGKIKECPVHLAVSPDDLSLLRELANGRNQGYVIPNGVDTEYFKPPAVSRQPPGQEEAVVFTGSMDWLPNNDAVVYFCDEILPLIWKKNPNIKFYVVGKGPSKNLQERAKREGRILLTGRVDDVRIYVRRSKVFVVPLRIGGGTRLKILEAMAMQKAVVSTKVGAEGIDYTKDKNIFLADDPADFAQKVISLFSDERKREESGVAARDLVLKKYDWNIAGETLRSIYEKTKR